VIAVAPVDAYEAPSDASKVVAQLGRDDAICVLDAGAAGSVQSIPGWLAIRIRGGSGIGYIHSEAVDQTIAQGQADDCERPAAPARAPVRTSSAAAEVPHRTRYLRLNHALARRILDALVDRPK